ncbi:hypothetical protein PM082_002148 [Marasmius tenuissimus]|nr:hypothetical protein PM082_002148 [Marasmius tenuissimus]
MSAFFPDARNFTVNGGSSAHVEGDPCTYKPRKEPTEFDDFRNIKRGDIYRARESLPLSLDHHPLPSAEPLPATSSISTKLSNAQGIPINGSPSFHHVRGDQHSCYTEHREFDDFRNITRGQIEKLWADHQDDPTPATTQDGTSGTNPSNPDYSPYSESNSVQTLSQTNQPENTATRDHTSHGSTSSPSRCYPAENWGDQRNYYTEHREFDDFRNITRGQIMELRADHQDDPTPATTQDDTGGTNPSNPFHSPYSESDPVQTRSQTNRDTATRD